MSSTPALLLLLAAFAVHALAAAPPEVDIAAGKLRGKWIKSQPSGRAIAAFEGVPFAQAPVGALRFQPPASVGPWEGVRAADQPGSMCLQRNIFFGVQHLEGSEDCLYINVYAPVAVARSKPLPVMVYIHGGGFLAGSGHIYGPELLLERDVVFVNFNYRLGPLGFFSSGDDVISGNYGLKDQVHALRWVKDNIRAFGGDPNMVTVFGESAGGASVHLLMLSPLSKGLFHRAAAMSGTALAPWAFHDADLALQQANKLAEVIGCPTQPSQALKDCLMAKTAEEITNTDLAFMEWMVHPMVPFRVTAEPSGPEAFLDKHPVKMYAEAQASDVPFMTGVTKHEGCIGVVPIAETANFMADFNTRYHEISPIIFRTRHFPADVNRRIYGQMREFYFGDKPIANETRFEFTDLLTDSLFAVSALETAKLQTKAAKSPVFFYEVARRSERSFSIPLGAKDSSYGVCHGDDLLYLFPLKMLFPQEPSADDKAYSNLLVDLYTTFAAMGTPTVDGSWRPVQAGHKLEYAHLAEAGRVSMRQDFAPERMSLWTKLPVNIAIAAPSLPGKDEL